VAGNNAETGLSRYSPRVSATLSLISFFVLLSPVLAFAGVTITALKGQAKVRNPAVRTWVPAVVNYILTPGEEIRTERRSQVTLSFDDGSKVEIGPKSSFALEAVRESRFSMRFNVGRMKAWVRKLTSRRFSVRTPTAVCSVRGTTFGVDVDPSGNTNVDLFEGLLGVGDSKGNEMLLQQGQHIGVTRDGLGNVITITQKSALDRASERAALKREVALDMTKDEVQAMAALEAKNAVYQQGKVMVDVNGNRVRLEQYIIRPAADQFKLVTLNERPDRFDYFYYRGWTNKSLPTDLRQAFQQFSGCVGSPCEWWVTAIERGRSNTTDSVLEVATGGHLVDVNNNGVINDEVNVAWSSAKEAFLPISGVSYGTDAGAGQTPFYKTLYDSYTETYNGVMHRQWAPNLGGIPVGLAYDATRAGTGNCDANAVGTDCGGIWSYETSANDLTDSSVVNVISGGNCTTLDNCTRFQDPDKYYQTIYSKNGAGTVWDKYENYIIDDEGRLQSRSKFASGSFLQNLSDVNYQQIITASEFQGRKIDLVFEPKTLIDSGLIP